MSEANKSVTITSGYKSQKRNKQNKMTSKKSEVKGCFASAVLTAVSGYSTNSSSTDTPEAPPLCSSQSENLDFANSKLSFLGSAESRSTKCLSISRTTDSFCSLCR
eukprot:GHVP01020711.1.p1 GENE.GHVP01020711.1~~GHVP01020711.1.p1  ORF type:complete len:106 (+),score=13.99 GHVP01020711.1:112-429(+)